MARIAAILVCVICLCLPSCKKSKPADAHPPIAVTVITVKPKTIPANYDYIGFAASSHPVEIRARVEGYLDQIAYVEGSLVKEGDLLFQIDPRPFQAALDQADAELKQQEAILWNATRTRERLEPLYKQNAASLRDLDNAIASELEALATVEANKANVEKARLNLSFTTINSPITGLSSKAKFREGSLIAPGPDSLLTTVSVIDPIWVYFTVSESDLLQGASDEAKGLLKFPKDMDFDVELILADGSIFPYQGKVNFAAPTISQSTGTLNVRATFNNPKGAVKPGQYVKARLIGAVRPHAIAVPQTAMLQGRTGMFVYVVNDKDQAEVRYVEPGPWYNNEWVIYSGLKEGERVVIEGVNKVQPDWPLKITNATKE